MPIEDNSRTAPSGALTVFWALFFFLVVALLLVIVIRSTGPTTEVEDNRAALRVAKRQDLARADAEKLSTVGWVDKGKQVVHVPLDQAKRLFLAEATASPKAPVASAVKISPVLPMQPPYDPNAAEPLPPAMPSAPQGADILHFEAPKVPAPAPSASITVGQSHLIVSALTEPRALAQLTPTFEITQ